MIFELANALVRSFEGVSGRVDTVFVVADEDDDKTVPIEVSECSFLTLVAFVPDFIEWILVFQLLAVWLVPPLEVGHCQVAKPAVKVLRGIYVVPVDGLLDVVPVGVGHKRPEVP